MRPSSNTLAYASLVLLLAACNTNSSEDADASEGALAGASNTTIITATATIENGKPRSEITFGFHDSSFDYSDTTPDLDSRTMCFKGDIGGTCAIIERYAAGMQSAYGNGGHDTMTMTSCNVVASEAGRFVDARYVLSDDYGGDLDVTRQIRECSQ